MYAHRKFHKKIPSKQLKAVKLNDQKHQSTTQKFIELYKTYQAQGALDDEKIFEVALEKMEENIKTAPSTPKTAGVTDDDHDWPIDESEFDLDLVSSFKTAQSKLKKVEAAEVRPKLSLQDYLKNDAEEEKK